MKEKYPILEYDGVSKPIITAKNLYNIDDSVKKCVITYFADVIEDWEREDKIFQAFRIRTEGVRPRVYKHKVGNEFVYIMPVAGGAPYAARAIESLSAMGVKKFIICGGAGTLDDSKTLDRILIPVSAVRDEGTSYHYLPPAREVEIDSSVLKTIEGVLKEQDVDYLKIKTWTTDASFRETVDKVALRKSEGCLAVEMECAAYYAVAKHKGLKVGQILYAGDIVKKEGWEYRNWHSKTDLRTKLLNLAIDIAKKM